MLSVLRSTWPLLLGVMLLMVGNGMQGTLLGIRGALEGIGTYKMSMVMSAYFAGFLLGSHFTPQMIARVGHVRVFAALGSMISAVLILYPAWPNWIGWAAMRVVMMRISSSMPLSDASSARWRLAAVRCNSADTGTIGTSRS